MRFLTSVLAVACMAISAASQGSCQTNKAQPDRPYLEHLDTSRLHFSVPGTSGTGRVEMAASSAERDFSNLMNLSSAEIEAVLKLRGNVDVMMCSAGDHGCERASMVLHADSVDYNENTQEINAHGDVRIEPFRSRHQDARLPH